MDETVANGQQNSSSTSDGLHPNHGSSGQHGSTCQSLLFPHPSPSEQPTTDGAQKQKLNDANKKFVVFFFHNSIPFSAAKFMYYQEMVDAIEECGVGFFAITQAHLMQILLLVVTCLWLLSAIGSYCSFFTLAYIGTILSVTLPAFYSKYEEPVNKYCGIIQRKFSQQYKIVDDSVTNRIPRTFQKIKTPNSHSLRRGYE